MLSPKSSEPPSVFCREIKLTNRPSDTSAAPQASALSPRPTPSTNFTLPEGLIAPLQLLTAGQPSPEQVALISTVYNPHWTTGAYFVVFVAAVSIACMYVFFLFQFAGMLREEAGGATPPSPSSEVKGKGPILPLATPKTRPNRFSWSSGGTPTSTSGKTPPSSKVMHALRLKKISGPSPIPEEVEMKDAQPYTDSEASGSGTREDEHDDKRDSLGGTWPRRPGSFPRLSFGPNSPTSPRSQTKKGYF
jgi:hypothetical protein